MSLSVCNSHCVAESEAPIIVRYQTILLDDSDVVKVTINKTM